jgi:hypothetical protein
MIKSYNNSVAECTEMLNTIPIFKKIAKALGYERVGLQILRNSKPIAQYTSFNENGRIIKIEKDLINPTFVTKIEESILEKMMQKEELKWMQKHPLGAAIKYKNEIEIPFVIKLKIVHAYLF